MVSGTGFRLAATLGLPTFEAGGVRLYKRLTLVIRDGVFIAALAVMFLRGIRGADAWRRAYLFAFGWANQSDL
jgi:hypothetical protein